MTKKNKSAAVVNARAHYDYVLGDKLEVGMVLFGPEVRAMRDHHAQIRGAYVVVRRGELWLVGMTLGAEMVRDVKLLATKRQIAGLVQQKVAGFTIVPVKLLPMGRHIKLVIALGRGKKRYDKRQTIKERDLLRENRRAAK